ncbi:MAG: glutathione peroxidase [Bacteroidota bacterium]
MKATLSILFFTILSMSISAQTQTLYNFQVKDINGKTFDLASLKGKKVMIINTASKCGYTPQYAGLEELYKKYAAKNFIIIGFPANNFGAQEPGNDSEIKDFCTKNYGVSFPMMSKISVKGDDMAPLYQWLTQKNKNGKLDSEVKWNFQKYLIDENGKLVTSYLSSEVPMSEKITSWIEGK